MLNDSYFPFFLIARLENEFTIRFYFKIVMIMVWALHDGKKNFIEANPAPVDNKPQFFSEKSWAKDSWKTACS